jgi:tellurium resistance protein TerD
MVNSNNDDEIIKCRLCSSTKIMAGEKGFSMGQAAANYLTFGILGALVAGNIGRKEIELTCLSCGYRWYPFNPVYKEIYEKEDLAKREKEEKRKAQEKPIISPQHQKRINRANEINQQTKMMAKNKPMTLSPIEEKYKKAFEKAKKEPCISCGRHKFGGPKIAYACMNGHGYCIDCYNANYVKENCEREVVIPKKGFFSTSTRGTCKCEIKKIPK